MPTCGARALAVRREFAVCGSVTRELGVGDSKFRDATTEEEGGAEEGVATESLPVGCSGSTTRITMLATINICHDMRGAYLVGPLQFEAHCLVPKYQSLN